MFYAIVQTRMATSIKQRSTYQKVRKTNINKYRGTTHFIYTIIDNVLLKDSQNSILMYRCINMNLLTFQDRDALIIDILSKCHRYLIRTFL